jgi:hypothetical protein
MQLDALLKSLQTNSKGFFDRIAVLYRTEDKKHKESYNHLKSKWKNVLFFEESFFSPFRKTLLKKCLSEDFTFTCFLVDDNLLFQDISNEKQNILSSFTNDVVTFSLRLGLNCTYSHPADKHFRLKNFVITEEKFLKWKWNEQDEGDFSYPLALDGHIFQTVKILPIINSISFVNPTSLEGNMQLYLDRIPDIMLSFEHSRLVGLPLNLTSKTANNFFGKKYFYGLDELCAKYREGWRINLRSMDFSVINGAHCELKLEFEKPG